ncbi:hypothetical protein ACQPZG_20620 [Streptomyces sp. CA-294286]|uniref:hypothetical protein n=1 Tax=Streptomyces sp. CA-294286 TaxID=3240070 RepID=UPI003D8FB799
MYCHNPDTMRMRGGRRYAADDIVAEAAKYATFIRAAGFHKLGEATWDALGKTFPLRATPSPGPAQVAAARAILAAHGLCAI